MPNNNLRSELRDIKNLYLAEVRGDRIELDVLSGTFKVPESIRKKYIPGTRRHSRITEAALTYKASERIKEIATPKRNFSPKKDNEKVLGAVKPTALAHQTTEKDYRLATPRVWQFPEGAHVKKDPFSTSKAAMNYKATPRIIELAKPAEKRF